MYCKYCGKKIKKETIICPYCGCATGNADKSQSYDNLSSGWDILGFLFPIIGLILYILWKDEFPLRAHCVGSGALVSVGVFIVLCIFLFPLVLASVIIL